MKRRGVMVCANYPDIRCGRITTAMRNVGWEHSVVTRGRPPQMEDAYTSIDSMPYRDGNGIGEALRKAEGEVVHVHGELDNLWPVLFRDSRPTILNVHDLKCARPDLPMDPTEEVSLKAADAHIWVSEEQRQWAGIMGLDISKPYVIIPNYCSSSVFVERRVLPHKGGLVYEGSIANRGSIDDRDFSPVADIAPLHIFPGGGAPDYGIVHQVELNYPLLIHKLSQYDWGLAGFPNPSPAWEHSFPTKASEYWAAGIPIIAMNTPLLKPFCELGMGVYITSVKEIPNVLKLDMKPYRKAVLANRGRFTTEAVIDKVADLYAELTGGA